MVDAMWCGTRFVHHSLSGENKGKRCDHTGSNPVLTTQNKNYGTILFQTIIFRNIKILVHELNRFIYKYLTHTKKGSG
jgi:hypothetical protein